METKTCTKCGEIKPLDEFKKDKRKPSGRGSHCKVCHNQHRTPYDGTPEARERYRVRYGGRYDRRKYQKTVNRGIAAWYAKHPGASRAHKAVNYAVKVGKLPHVSSQLCQCGAQAQEYHHYLGYDREHRLDVIPLCRTCHRAIESD